LYSRVKIKAFLYATRRKIMENTQQDDVFLSDDMFKNYAKKLKEDEANRPRGNFTPRDYENLKWVGLEKGDWKFIRFIGAPRGIPGYTPKSHDPIELIVCDVKADDGKRMQIKLPVKTGEEASEHIVHRMYDRVCEVAWIAQPGSDKKKKVFVNEAKYPALFDAVTKTGFVQGKDGLSYSYASGLKGQQVVVYNVIDRSDKWCAENKHTKLLSKEVNTDTNDAGEVVEYAKTGIPSYGFITPLADVISAFGNYEKYDIAIRRTGVKENPYLFENASKLKDKDFLDKLVNDSGSEIDASLIHVGLLTEEEMAYERYDLPHLFQPTSYQKLEKRIGSVFKLVDATLSTHYFEELQSLAKAEKAKWDEINASKETAQETTETEVIKEELGDLEEIETPKPAAAAPVRQRVGAPVVLSNDKIAALKGWNSLKDEERAAIVDVNTKDGKVASLVFSDDVKNQQMLECPDCGVPAPESFTTVCPVCNTPF
jgi:hypothetical protein